MTEVIVAYFEGNAENHTESIVGFAQLGSMALPDKKKKAENKHLPWENEF